MRYRLDIISIRVIVVLGDCMNRIAELRKARGISQSELAKTIGVAQNTVSQYENEVRKPTGRALLALASFFGVTTRYILCIPDDDTDRDSSTDPVDLSKITQIRIVSSESDVNNLLRIGWKLLHIGTDTTPYNDGTVSSSVLYTLGHSGAPISEFPFILDADDPGAATLETFEEW